MAGVRYDAYNLTKADGKGKWWEGYDPQELYTGRNLVMPDGITTIAEANAWHKANDAQLARRDSGQQSRVRRELVPALPGPGRHLQARPALLRRHRAALRAVRPRHSPRILQLSHPRQGPPRRRGHRQGLSPITSAPSRWTSNAARPRASSPTRGRPTPASATGTTTSRLFENHKYKTPKSVIHSLIDIVSKNGNLMLNIPVKGDGTIDSDERAFLEAIATWIPKHGEAIYGTRPFAVFGEGPPDVANNSNFNERNQRAYTAEDIRFTRKGDTVYAFAFVWPDNGKLTHQDAGAGLCRAAQADPARRADRRRPGEVRSGRHRPDADAAGQGAQRIRLRVHHPHVGSSTTGPRSTTITGPVFLSAYSEVHHAPTHDYPPPPAPVRPRRRAPGVPRGPDAGADARAAHCAWAVPANLGFIEEATPRRTGFATPSSASGTTGRRSASPGRATGMRARCTSRVTGSTTITSTTYGHPSKFGFMELDQPLEGRELEASRVDGPLRRRRGQVFHRAGQSSRQLRLLQLPIHSMELGEDRAKEGHRWHLRQASQRARAPLRRLEPRLTRVELATDLLQLRR